MTGGGAVPAASAAAQPGLSVIAVFRAKPGAEEAFRRELDAAVGPARAEGFPRGLLHLDTHRDPRDPARFMLYEHWRSREHFDAYHADRPRVVQAFFDRLGPMLAHPMDQQLLRLATPLLVPAAPGQRPALTVLTAVRAGPGMGDAVREALTAWVSRLRGEPDLADADLLEGLEADGRFTLHANWRTPPAAGIAGRLGAELRGSAEADEPSVWTMLSEPIAHRDATPR